MSRISSLLLLHLICVLHVHASFIPQFKPTAAYYRSPDSSKPYFRQLTVNSIATFAYIGAKNSVYKIDLNPLSVVNTPTTATTATTARLPPADHNSTAGTNSTRRTLTSTTASPVRVSGIKRHEIMTSLDEKPDFGKEETMVGYDKRRDTELWKYVNTYINDYRPVQLKAQELLAQVYKLPNVTYLEQCQRQIKILKIYYGDNNLLHSLDPDLVCGRHVRGLTILPNGKLFTVKTGIFGTQPVAPTGVSEYEPGFPAWLNISNTLSYRIEEVSSISQAFSHIHMFMKRVADADRTCYWCNYSKNWTACQHSQYYLCWREYEIDNYMGVSGLCDYTPAPTRTILNIENMKVQHDGPIQPTSRETCKNGNLASTLFAGYHPDQVTITHYSESGHSGEGAAVYIMTEIGQEKQLDVNHEAFMGYEEPLPTGSSASLAIVRLQLKSDGDIDHEKILVSNPFKHTWVTSPLTKFGRLVKTGNQATVPHRPRPISIFEDDRYVYFLFREVEWEGLNLPAYTMNRYHYLWRSYDQTIAFPYESNYTDKEQTWQYERTDPAHFVDASSLDEFKTYTDNAHVYAPPLHSWEQIWKQSKMATRIARICKSDEGLPLGVQDPSIFNLDNKLSLSAFQTFLKTKLTCVVRARATPRTWRHRLDDYNLFFKLRFPSYSGGLTRNQAQTCTEDSGCQDSCYQGYLSNATTKSARAKRGAFCDKTLYGRDVTFRSFLPEYRTSLYGNLVKDGMFETVMNEFSQSRWKYDKMKHYDTVTYEYTEMKDIYQLGDYFYGIFTTPLIDEALTDDLPSKSAICEFTKSDIDAAFSGPFKKRVNNAWRRHDPKVEGNKDGLDPRSCSPDPIKREAESVEKMNVDFTDESLPLNKETFRFDMRNKSERLKYFEQSDTNEEGTRTMWNSVESELLISIRDYIYVKILAQPLPDDARLFYLLTDSGEIHKYMAFKNPVNKTCWTPDLVKLKNWWKLETSLRNNSWGVDYFDLTQEKNYKEILDDYLYKTQKPCKQPHEFKLLTRIKPFDKPTKVWDWHLAVDKIVIISDDIVISLPLNQCEHYEHCSTCSYDPDCGWNKQTGICVYQRDSNIVSGVTATDCTECVAHSITYDPSETLVLDVTVTDFTRDNTDQLAWYHNESLVEESAGRFLITRNGSLAIVGLRPADSGLYELKLTPQSTDCIVSYKLQISDCQTEQCRYDKKTAEWCTEYEKWQRNMFDWEKALDVNECRPDDV